MTDYNNIPAASEAYTNSNAINLNNISYSTIADLDNSPTVKSMHIAEAIGYRNLDRENWGA